MSYNEGISEKNRRKSSKKPNLRLSGESKKVHPIETLNTPSPPKKQTLRRKNNTDNFSGGSAYPYENLMKLNDEIRMFKQNQNPSMNVEMFLSNNIKPFLSFYEQAAWRSVYDEDLEFVEEDKISALYASADGSTVVTIGENKFKGRRLDQGGYVTQTKSWANKNITAGCLSNDGSKLFLGSATGDTSFWLLHDQFEISTEFTDHSEKVVSVCFSKNGDRIASCGIDKKVVIRSPSNRLSYVASLTNVSALLSIVFHPNEIHLLSADETNTVKVWHIYTGDIVSLLYHEGSIKHIWIDETGTMLLTCMEKNVRIWTLENLLSDQVENEYYDLVGHTKMVNKAVVSPNQKKILSISSDSTLRIWDTESCEEDFVLTTDKDFSDALITNHSIIFAINNKLIIKCRAASTKFKRTEFPDLSKISSICFDSADEKIAVAFEDRDIKILHLNERMKEFDFVLSRHNDIVTCVRFNQYNDNCLASGSRDKMIIIWDLKTRSCKKIIQNSNEAVFRILFARGGNHLLSSGRRSLIKYWSLEQINEELDSGPLRTLELEEQRNFTFAYDQITEVIATGGSEKVLSFWRFDEIKAEYILLDEKNFDQEITYIDCNSFSNVLTFAVSFLYESVRIFNKNFDQIKEIKCLRCQISKAILHPFSGKLFVSTLQNAIQVWCLESGMKLNLIENKFPANEHGISLSNKGLLLAVGGKDGKLRIIDMLSENCFLGVYKSYHTIRKHSFQVLTEDILEKSAFEKIALQDEVFPLEMNFLSWIVYKEDMEVMEKFYELCKFFDVYPPQKPDWKGEFPLQTVVKSQNRKFIGIVLGLYFRKVPHIGCARYISPDLLSSLIKMNIDSVSEIITSRLLPIKSKNNPWMTGEKNYFSSPLCLELDCSITVPKERSRYKKVLSLLYRILRIKENEPIPTPAVCYILDIGGILSPSNIFLWNITRLNSLHRVFKNEGFLAILGLKWDNYAKTNFLKETIYFLIFLLLCTLNSVFILPERIFEINQSHIQVYSRVAVAMNLIIFFYIPFLAKRELYQIKRMGLKIYLDSFWNYLDLFTIVFGTLTIALDLFQIMNSSVNDKDIVDPLKILHSFLLFISWIRVLNVARGFEGSSFMIHVFSAIFSNYAIKWFIFWIFWILLGTSYVVYILNIGDEGNSRFTVFKSIYYVLLGDFGDFKSIYSATQNFPNLLWFILLLTSIIMTIIMMNLLIAIISEIYTKVKEVEDEAFIFEKTLIISEVDKQYTDDYKHHECFNVDDYLILAKSGQNMEISRPVGGATQSQIKYQNPEIQQETSDNEFAYKMKNLESKMANIERMQSNPYGTNMENYKTKFLEKRDKLRRNTVRNFLEKMAQVAGDSIQEETSPRLRVFRHLDKDHDGLIASVDLERALVEAKNDFKTDELHKVLANFRSQGKLKYTKDEFYDWCRTSLEYPTLSNFNASNLFLKNV